MHFKTFVLLYYAYLWKFSALYLIQNFFQSNEQDVKKIKYAHDFFFFFALEKLFIFDRMRK